MNYQLAFPPTLHGTIILPASKSISARALVMGALAGNCHLSNLSDCDDTRVLRRALEERRPEIDIMAAGTAMRFSTAYFATCPGETHVITGTERMQQRPIKVLVDALRLLGADIEYVGNEGYPPLRIKGKTLAGGEVALPANVSSQYISALLMIGPTLQQGLRLHLIGEVVSRPYIDMTLGLMKEFGAKAQWTSEQELYVAPHPYTQGMDFCGTRLERRFLLVRMYGAHPRQRCPHHPSRSPREQLARRQRGVPSVPPTGSRYPF